MSQLSARAQLEQRGGRAEILSVKHNLELNDNNTDKKELLVKQILAIIVTIVSLEGELSIGKFSFQTWQVTIL